MENEDNKGNKIAKSVKKGKIAAGIVSLVIAGLFSTNEFDKELNSTKTYEKKIVYSNGDEEVVSYADTNSPDYEESVTYSDNWVESDGLYKRKIYTYDTTKINDYTNEQLLNMTKEELDDNLGEPSITNYYVNELEESDNRYFNELVSVARTNTRVRNDYLDYIISLMLIPSIYIPLSLVFTKIITQEDNEDIKKLTK